MHRATTKIPHHIILQRKNYEKLVSLHICVVSLRINADPSAPNQLITAYDAVRSKALNFKTMPQWQLLLAPLLESCRECWRERHDDSAMLVPIGILLSIVTPVALALAAFTLVVCIPITISTREFLAQSAISDSTRRAVIRVMVLSAFSWICGVVAGPWLRTRLMFQLAAAISASIMFLVALEIPDVDPSTIYSPSDPQYASIVLAHRPSLIDVKILSWLSAGINVAWVLAMYLQGSIADRSGSAIRDWI